MAKFPFRRLLAAAPIAAVLASTAVGTAQMHAVTTDRFRPLTFAAFAERPRPRADATIAYGADPLQRVDVWLPTAGTRPYPAVIMVHGGCWQSDVADRTLMSAAADDLRRHGIAVWNIDYRGVDRPGGGYPGTFRDVSAAADALRVNAARFHIDPRRVIAVGHSAGGHLALWLAARPRLAGASMLHTADPLSIRRVISLGGLPDLEATAASPDNGCGTDVVAKLVGAGRVDRFADTSISHLLPLGVAQDLVNGREDHIIPYRLATDYLTQAKKAGDPVVLHTVPNTDHFELIAPETAAWAETRRLILAAFTHR